MSLKYILNLSKRTANSCTLTLMMASSIFHLLEVIYAKNVACKVPKIRNDCCGCKVYEQDCLMMDEHETWQMHEFNAIEHANNTSSTWNEFMAFTQHLMCWQEEPDQNFVYLLLQVQYIKTINHYYVFYMTYGIHKLIPWNPMLNVISAYRSGTPIMSKGQRKHSNLSKRITKKRIRNI